MSLGVVLVLTVLACIVGIALGRFSGESWVSSGAIGLTVGVVIPWGVSLALLLLVKVAA